MAYIGAEPAPGQNRAVDDISSSFNGSTTAFTLQVSGVNFSPESANNILVSLGGVMQKPGTDYTIAAATITFTTAPASGLSFWALILGDGIDTATVADQTIGPSKLLNTAVTAGSYTTADITVDAQGRITAAASGTIANAEIADGAVNNAKVNASAAIAGTKISPDFGSQNVVSTGTSNALGTTTIKGGSNAAARLLLQNTTSVRTNFIGLSSDDDTIVISADDANQGSNSTVEFKVDGSERMRIDSSGRLLLGTTTEGHANGDDLTIATSGNTGLTIRSGTSSAGNIYFSDGTSGDDEYRGFISYDHSNNLFNFATNSAAKMTIDSSGNVMIGATSASGKLHVEHSGEVLAYIIGNTSTAGSRLVLQNKNTTANSHTGVLGADAGGQTTAQVLFYSADNDNNEGFMTFETRPSGGVPTERMRIDSSGNLGVGLTNPTGKFAVSDGTVVAEINPFASSSGAFIGTRSNHAVLFKTNATERMRITSGGALRVNTTSAYSNEKFNFFFSGGADNQDCFTINNHNSYENVALTLRHGRGGLSGYSGKMISFLGADNSEEGSVVIGTSSVAYNTSSDYRLKENQVLISDGITRLKTLKPYRFNFKKDTDTIVDGFFAHEVTAVPEAVSGDKDAMKKIYYVEGDTLPSGKNVGDFKEFSSTEISSQSIDQSKLVPLLTAALQEAITKIETLETKVAALEAA